MPGFACMCEVCLYSCWNTCQKRHPNEWRKKRVDETLNENENKSSWKMSFNFEIAIYFSDFHLNLRRMHMNWCRDFFLSFSFYPCVNAYDRKSHTQQQKIDVTKRIVLIFNRRQKMITSRFVINSVLKRKKEKSQQQQTATTKKTCQWKKETKNEFPIYFRRYWLYSHSWRGKQYTAYFLYGVNLLISISKVTTNRVHFWAL